MKDLVYMKYICFILAACLISGCAEEEVNIPKGPANIQASPGFGEALFTWAFPEGDNIEYVRVDYQNTEGKRLHQKFSRYTEVAVISGLEEREYEFAISVADRKDNLSAAELIKVTPNKPPHLFVANTVEVVPDFGSAIVTWENETEKEVAVNVRYKDKFGTEQLIVFGSSERNGKGVIPDLGDEEQEFVVYVSNLSGMRSETKTFTLAPYRETTFDKGEWEVVDISSEQSPGMKDNLIDDDISTIWHSPWSWSQPDYPHYFTVDMKAVKTVSRIVLVNRQNDSRGMTKFRLEGSVDGEEWINLGEFPFEQINAAQSFRISSNPQIRYFKMTALEGPNFFTFLAEASALGQE
jgi:hypothetical protein